MMRSKLFVRVSVTGFNYLLMQKWRGRILTTSLRRLWARFLFKDRGIVPTKRLMYLISGLGLILFIISFFRFDLIIFASVIVSVVLLSLLDLLRSPNRKELAIRRVIPEQVERHQREKLSLIVTNRSDK